MNRRTFIKSASLSALAISSNCPASIASATQNVNHLPASPDNHLKDICSEMTRKWPKNRTVNIVCHGHSVPAGYFKTPTVDTFNAYPHLLHLALKQRYPYAVINVIVTAIGGENSLSGAKRFQRDVLACKPDIVMIDYALNDRRAGLPAAKKAWTQMINQAGDNKTKVILCTGTIDINHTPNNMNQQLNQHAQQIRQLAAKHNTGLIDSLKAFDNIILKGTKNADLLSNNYNHPNRIGHELVADQIIKWFPQPIK